MKIEVKSKQSSYDIVIENGLLQEVAAQIAPMYSEIVIITDHTVKKLYGDTLLEQLRSKGARASIISVEPGEESKGQATLFWLYGELCRLGLTRTGGIVALGGGVVGDLAGYTAATFLRGVGLVQIPTTLLAQVDSSVGGKTAIDLPQGKNLVGAFYQPQRVFIDPECLSTLELRQLKNGMAEVVKYGFIRDEVLFEQLLQYDMDTIRPHLVPIIGRCCEIKRDYVQEDTFDHGKRMELNFGHTIGHAMEMGASGRLLHGEAISHGMVYEARVGERMGFGEKDVEPRVRQMLLQYGLLDTSVEHIDCSLLDADKKSVGSRIYIVLLRKIGDADAVLMDKWKLFDMIKEGSLDGSYC